MEKTLNVNVEKLKHCYRCQFERQSESFEEVTLCDYVYASNLVDAYNLALEMQNAINKTLVKNENQFELVFLERKE